MTELALVGCTKRKRDTSALARDLYDESPLFRRRRRLARKVDDWAILSAEHGLVHTDEQLEPYDTHISEVDQAAWRQNVLASLTTLEFDEVLILAGGRDYVDPLVDPLERRGISVSAPLRKQPPGKQFNILDDLLAEGTQTTLATGVQNGGEST